MEARSPVLAAGVILGYRRKKIELETFSGRRVSRWAGPKAAIDNDRVIDTRSVNSERDTSFHLYLSSHNFFLSIIIESHIHIQQRR